MQEDFLDLSVAIAAGAGLQDVLHGNYVEMESLSGNNQYRCEACQKLVDAKKVVVWDSYSYSSISVLRSEPVLDNSVNPASFSLLMVRLHVPSPFRLRHHHIYVAHATLFAFHLVVLL